MAALRSIEHPVEILKRCYLEAEKSGIFEKVTTICRLFGTTPAGDKNQAHLFRLVHGEISLFLDGHDGSLTVYYGNDMVCNTQEGNQIFVYGAWVNYIEELYQALTMKNQP